MRRHRASDNHMQHERRPRCQPIPWKPPILPVYRRRNYEAATHEEACSLALDDGGWEDAEEDVDTSGETYVTWIWKGRNAEHSGEGIVVPEEFGETVQRKADLFDALVAIVREPARPMGLSQYQFEHWLPRALSVLAKADAIAGTPVPERP